MTKTERHALAALSTIAGMRVDKTTDYVQLVALMQAVARVGLGDEVAL